MTGNWIFVVIAGCVLAWIDQREPPRRPAALLLIGVGALAVALNVVFALAIGGSDIKSVLLLSYEGPLSDTLMAEFGYVLGIIGLVRLVSKLLGKSDTPSGA
jgi:hypothetical protein